MRRKPNGDVETKSWVLWMGAALGLAWGASEATSRGDTLTDVGLLLVGPVLGLCVFPVLYMLAWFTVDALTPFARWILRRG